MALQSLPVISDAPTKVFTTDELEGCRDTSECCKCGLCCAVFSIHDMPLSDGAPGTIKRHADGSPMTGCKSAGEFCWHLQKNGKGEYGCAIYDSPHKPAVCDEWRGSDGGNYRQMARFAFEDLLRPRTLNTIEYLRTAIANNAIGLVRRDPCIDEAKPPLTALSVLETRKHFNRVVFNYIWSYGLFEPEIFEYLGISRYLDAVRGNPDEMQQLLRETGGIGLQQTNDVHRRFVETYFTQEEQSAIWSHAARIPHL